MTDTKNTHFPYKTLIWALLAALSLFLFKPELKRLLSNAEKVSVFGIEINASKEQVKKLQDSIQSFEAEISSLSGQITNQEHEIQALDDLKTQLQNDLSNCPRARANTAKLNLQLNKIMANNSKIINKSEKLKNMEILQRTNFIRQ